ncbi:MAG: hypothetical protein KatS3mg031_2712 [Chitinophagales bacterium]|nr:MAG: hypothetical protein KatS3mg031_2712 [Chitinophagales bacterium]
MQKSFTFLSLLIFMGGTWLPGYSQSTFSTIRSIVQAKCATSGCHDGSVAGAFDATVSAGDLYDMLINGIPENQTAVQKGNKLVEPGHPYNSFFLRKIAGPEFDPFMTLDAGESDNKHAYNASAPLLEKYEIELIRQWIIKGAPETGNAVNYPLLQDYYINGGTPFIPVPPAPQAGKGIQFRMGPIFLAPGEEIEVMKKEYVRNQSVAKISRMSGYMTTQSHHLLLFKMDDNGRSTREGTRVVPLEGQPFNNGTLTGAWQDDGDLNLPEGTAFIWDANTVLDFDYHITNRGNNEILPADFYLNIEFYDLPSPPIEMHAQLENVIALLLPMGESVRTDVHRPGGGTRYIWLITTHTHKFGTDYDIYLRNPDGSRGEQIYEGFYDVNYEYPVGYYDWEHPPIRKFEPELKPFNGSDGLIFETRWDVTGPCTLPSFLGCVSFGLTTADEMQLFTYLYTNEPVPAKPTSVQTLGSDVQYLTVYPNPASDHAVVTYTVEKPAQVSVELFDVMGKKIATLQDEKQTAGTYNLQMPTQQMSRGVYFVSLSVDGKVIGTRKVTLL